ncbi:hypothetical protein TYRP_013672 [Tyrophagus putrescentiae]|nr:hypothetical protein TYRP_013672 [Tyrophagus putrescentiae]
MMMPGADDNTALMSLPPPPPSSSTEKVPSCTTPPKYDANDDVAVQEQQQPFKDTSAELFGKKPNPKTHPKMNPTFSLAQAQRVSAASDVYFSQFLALLEEEVDSVCSSRSISRKPTRLWALPWALVSTPAAASTVCSCSSRKKGTVWRALPDCITTSLPYSGLRVELLSCGSIHLTGPYLSLFIGGGSGDQNSITPTTVVVNFHGTSKVLLRCGGGGGGNGGGKEGGGDNPQVQQQQPPRNSCEVDILSGPYTVALRPGQASLSSSANVLTYVIDKAGTTKTKIIKQHQQQKSSENSSSSWGLSLASEEDQVLKAVQQALTGGRAKWQAETKKKKQLRLKEVAEKEKEKEKEVAPPVAPLKFTRKWQLPKEKKGQQQQNNFWTFEDGLTIHDQADGTLQLYYSIGSKSKKSQQLQQQMNEPQANPLQLLVNSQHLYLQQQQQVCAQLAPTTAHTFDCHRKLSQQTTGQVNEGGSSKRVNPCVNLSPPLQPTMMVVAKDGGEEVAKKVLPIVPALSPVPANFSLPSLLSTCEQYALGGPGSGLLVKHRHRRAGLNSRNLICLL